VLSSLAVLAAGGPLSAARMCGGTSGGGGSWRWRRSGGGPRAAAGAAVWARGDAEDPKPASKPASGCWEASSSAGPAACRLLPELLQPLQLPGLLCCQLPRWAEGVGLLIANVCGRRRGWQGAPYIQPYIRTAQRVQGDRRSAVAAQAAAAGLACVQTRTWQKRAKDAPAGILPAQRHNGFRTASPRGWGVPLQGNPGCWRAWGLPSLGAAAEHVQTQEDRRR
jgi:hypothetical protein